MRIFLNNKEIDKEEFDITYRDGNKIVYIDSGPLEGTYIIEYNSDMVVWCRYCHFIGNCFVRLCGGQMRVKRIENAINK